MKEQEFEKQQLNKLINDLRDINTYTSFKNGAFIYDLGHYQGLLLLNEIDRLNNIINELEKWVIDFTKPKDSGFGDTTQGYMIFPHAILDKLKELKDSNNGN